MLRRAAIAQSTIPTAGNVDDPEPETSRMTRNTIAMRKMPIVERVQRMARSIFRRAFCLASGGTPQRYLG